MRTREGPDQRRLAGAVASYQTDNLAGPKVDRHVLDGVEAAEGDIDVAQLNQGRLRDRRG
jgi:hypothetical protein